MARVYKKNYLTQHRNGWRFVRAVPDELQALEGRKQWSKYLGVIAYDAAEVEARKLASHYDARIAKLKRLSKADRDTVTKEGSLDAYTRTTEGLEDAAAFAAAAVELMPLTTRPEYPGYLEDVANWTEEKERTIRAITKRKQVVAKLGTGTKLKALVDLWANVKKPGAPKTIKKANLYATRFVAICGNLEARHITREHAVMFRKALDADPKLSRGTVNLHLEKFRTMFNIAISENMPGIASNPFALIKSQQADEREDKLPFIPEQVRTILKLAKDKGDEFYALTLILTYSGARSSEIAQLTKDDVQTVRDIAFLEIHDRNGSLKNDPRHVPLHPVCAGVVRDLVSKATGTPGWLFPQLVDLDNANGRGGKFGRLFGRFLRNEVGIKNPRLSLHCLRHSFIDACREAEMPEHIASAISGHTLGKGHHGAYGKGVSLKLRAKWIAKVDPALG